MPLEDREWSLDSSRVAGAVLLSSIFAWWIGLQWWATAQHGYLDLETVGASPRLWVLLVAAGGLGLLSGWLKGSGAVVRVTAAVAFLLPALASATVNIAYGVNDGISPAGWLLGLFSLAQIPIFLAAVLLPLRTGGSRTTEPSAGGSTISERSQRRI